MNEHINITYICMFMYICFFVQAIQAPQNKNPITNVIKTHVGGT